MNWLIDELNSIYIIGYTESSTPPGLTLLLSELWSLGRKKPT